MSYKSFKDLIVWQKGMQLAQEVYKITESMPKEELFSLTNQMRRAVISIPSNIAEGQGRNSDTEFARFLSIAQGSRAELETQLLLCNSLNYLTEEQTATAFSLCDEISKIISSLILKLKT